MPSELAPPVAYQPCLGCIPNSTETKPGSRRVDSSSPFARAATIDGSSRRASPAPVIRGGADLLHDSDFSCTAPKAHGSSSARTTAQRWPLLG